ncbi:hypothetical protein [Pseudaminobacter soli (ex Li et al. 2025)]|uniref:hypothetical protein n=1 Tax=Pseudaminobacter soli (ex Li et al. 2025) TaxID=1295366 RepID=UPI0024768BBC|nr:hypothetical protein [Mesorhizobium soli]
MLLPALTGSIGFSFDGFSHQAYAKGEGGGKGGGNGGGKGGGNAGSSGAGKGGGNAGSNGAGKGGGQGAGAAKAGERGNAKGLGGPAGGGAPQGKGKGAVSRMAAVSATDTGRKPGKASSGKVKEKNLHAKLGGLNSLKRNFNAFLNANDPKFAAIRSYVMASASYDLTEADLAKATAALAAANASFDASIGAIQPQDDFSYTPDLTTTDLEARLGSLKAIDPSTLDADAAAALAAEIDALDSALGKAAAVNEAEKQVADLEAKQAEQKEAITDEALTAALQAGANPNRVVDQEMVDWAKDVLGVGETYGKIDQVREALQTQTVEPTEQTNGAE